MREKIKRAYDKIYLDNDTKQRVLMKLDVAELQQQFDEENEMGIDREGQIKRTVSLHVKKEKHFTGIMKVAASFLILGGIVATIGVGLQGSKSSGGGGNGSAIVENTSTPNPSIVASSTPTVSPSTDPTPTSTSVAPSPTTTYPDKIVIDQKEFKEGINRMKVAKWGADFPAIIYASESLAIVRDSSGMAFYDLKNKECLGVLDTPKYDINRSQGDGYTIVNVSKDGRYVSFKNADNAEVMYLFDVKNLTLEKGKSLEDVSIYKDFNETPEELRTKLYDYFEGKYGIDPYYYVENEKGDKFFCGLSNEDVDPKTGETIMEGITIFELKGDVSLKDKNFPSKMKIYKIFK